MALDNPIRQEAKRIEGVFPERLRTAMDERGATVESLIHWTQVGESTILAYLVGRLPRVSTVCRIARYLGVSVDWLLGQDKAPPLDRRSLTDKEQLVLAAIDVNDEGSFTAIARTVGLTRPDTIRIIRSLSAAGWVTIDQGIPGGRCKIRNTDMYDRWDQGRNDAENQSHPTS